ncbi:MAG: futalosine hydrolase [Bacteroidia bacterium]|nr:futalosine hydrolase [Bacteroidia bacterium]
MPKFLIVAATKQEIQPLLTHFNVTVTSDEGLFTSNSEPNISILITGVGMVNTAYQMGRYSHTVFDHIINVGVCGAFDRDLKPGEVVVVVEDTISEMGAEDDNLFIKYTDMNLGGTNVYTHQIRFQNPSLDLLKKVKAITVNKVHGNEASIKNVSSLFEAHVESMEGAAFFRGCVGLSENYYQLRAVSNYVEKRDKSKWNMPLAINNLNSFVVTLITDLNK